VDHRSTVLNEPIGALAHLQLGHAYPLSGDIIKRRRGIRTSLFSGSTPILPCQSSNKPTRT